MLQISNVSKTYGDDTILENVSFVVNPGDRAGLVGPNGCGKTLYRVQPWVSLILGLKDPGLWPQDKGYGAL